MKDEGTIKKLEDKLFYLMKEADKEIKDGKDTDDAIKESFWRGAKGMINIVLENIYTDTIKL